MLDQFTPRVMLDALVQVPPVWTFLLNLFFPTRKIHDTDTIDIDIVGRQRKVAKFVSPDSEGTHMGREGFRADTLILPYVKPVRTLTPKDVMTRLPGETIYMSRETPETRLSKKIGEDLEELRQYVIRLEEWMASQALIGGRISLRGEGVDAEVDFQMKPSHKIVLSGTDLLSHPDCDVLALLRSWKTLCSKDSGLVPDVAVLGSDVIDAVLNNKTVQAQLDNRRYDMGEMAPRDLPNGASYVGRLADTALYGYNEWFVDDAGEEHPMVPADRILLGSTKARTCRHYGLIQDFDAMGKAYSGVADYFPKLLLDRRKSIYEIMLQSAPLVVPHQIDAFASIKAL